MWPFTHKSKPPAVPQGEFWDGFESADGVINLNHAVFQQGRNLYDAQVMLADIEAGRAIDPAKLKELLHEFCRLINGAGYLRAMHEILRDG